MAPTKHALLGASKAHQWLECPPSARFEEKFDEPAQSEAAAEGSVAHALAEHHLTKMLQGKRVLTPKAIREDPLYKPAMEEHVATYCDVVMETITEMQQRGDIAYYLEQELDLSPWIPEGFGTADCVIIGDGTIHIFDFKYGKGVPVYAEENPQLKLYALGCIAEFGCLYDIQEAVLHIVQPRLDSITEWTVSREVLEGWGDFIVKPLAKQAFAGEGDFNPGESQCRWCRAKNRCKAYNKYLLETCQMRFDDYGIERDANELSDAEIAEILAKGDEIKRWINGVNDYALDQALNHGVNFPGYKLVEGRSVRKITEEAVVITKLDDKGFTTDKTCRLKGITDLEDLVGKKELQALVGEYIIKPKGKPVLVPETDARPVYTIFDEVKE